MKKWALTTWLLLFATLHALADSLPLSDFERIKSMATEMAIPLVNITVDISAVTKTEYTPGTLEIFDHQARTNNTQDVRLKCKVKYRGASSLAYDKKSFAIKTLDENGEKANVNIFGIREDDSWILDAMAIDRLRMRNRLCFDLWNEISRTPYETDCGGRNGTLGVFVEVFINGAYHGLYCMTDKINRKLLGLKKAKEKDDGSVAIRGVLYKNYTYTHASHLGSYDESQPLDTTSWNGYELQYPDDYLSKEAWQPLMDFIDFFQLPYKTFSSSYSSHLYADNLVSYAILILSVNYGDCIAKNTFFSNPDVTKDQRFLITPWDMDMSFGGNWDGAYNDGLSNIKSLEDTRLFCYLLERNIDGFRDSCARKWENWAATTFLPENVYRRIDDYAAQFTSSGAWRREVEKWDGNPVPLKENLADETEYVKDWYARNYKNVCATFGTGTGISTATQKSRTGKKFRYSVSGAKIGSKQRMHGVVIENGRKVLYK